VPHDYDLLVIGSGPAGEKGAAAAAWFGKRVLLIERAPVLGGACVNTGTLPSKTLRETALYMSGIRQRQLYGMHARLSDAPVGAADLMCRKRPVIDAELDRINRNIARHRIELWRGTARFVDPHTLDVKGPDGAHRRASGDVVLVAVGSRPARPPEFPWDDGDVEDSDTILGIERLPHSLAVVGAGVIGCEYASMLQQLGVEVLLFDRGDRLLPFLDAEVSARLELFFRTMGMQVVHGARIERVEAVDPGGVVVHLPGQRPFEVDKLLFAAGRVANTDGLGLETVGVRTNERGQIRVDESFRTNTPSIFAAGDCIGVPALASVSMDQARVAVSEAFGFGYHPQVRSLLPMAIYGVPEVSFVGETEESARAAGVDYAVGTAVYRDNARGQIIGAVQGMLKLLVRRDDRRLIGVHIVGDLASELIHLGQSHLFHGATVDQLLQVVMNYPTLAECYKYAAFAAMGALSGRAAAVEPPRDPAA
jgi:NAD(P) transhydrogenase